MQSIIKRITIKNAGIKPSLYRRIRQYANVDIHRMNASSADLYTFTIDEDGKSWSGGWSWLDTPNTWDGNLAIRIKDGKLYSLIRS